MDANQPDIVKAYRQAGASVQHLHTVGHGCPDLAVGLCGINFFVEIKVPGEDTNDEQKEWAASWRGAEPVIVRSVEEAVLHVQIVRNILAAIGKAGRA